MDKKYNRTLFASYVGYIVQAIVNNLIPLLLVTFQKQFNIPTYLLTFIITYNFVLQIIIDSVSAKLVLKFGYNIAAITAHALSTLGLLILGFLPDISDNYIFSYAMIMLAVTFMATGSGFIEVIISPIIESLPLGNKSASMSLLHSFYCLGHLGVILISTLYFNIFGIENWKYLAVFWAIIPLVNTFLFFKAPIVSPEGDDKPVKAKKLFSDKLFLLFFLMMICAGAAEQSVAQWVSYFAEVGLNVNKTTGDLLGTCLFAASMFITRLLYGTVLKDKKLETFIFICCIGLIVGYSTMVFSPNAILSLMGTAVCGLSVGIMWPGTYSIAGKEMPLGGTTMFAFLALGGDLGCTFGPTLVGLVSSSTSLKLGFLVATVFPVILTVGIIILLKRKKPYENS